MNLGKSLERKVNFLYRVRKALLPILNHCVEAKWHDAGSLGEFTALCKMISTTGQDTDDDFHQNITETLIMVSRNYRADGQLDKEITDKGDLEALYQIMLPYFEDCEPEI